MFAPPNHYYHIEAHMDTVQKFSNLKEQIEKLTTHKIRIEERYKAEREKLEKLVKDITAKGYDPSKLAETKALKEEEFNKALAELEAKVNEVSSKISVMEL